MKQLLFTNWHTMRWIRLISGLFLAVGAFQMHDIWLGLAAGLLLFQAATNTGCCASGACQIPIQQQPKQEDNKVQEPVNS
ncbi:MAG: hypothetical protein K6T34_01010 [Thermoflavifilum sp.]|nr:hypothetical protein [Thermoflavifilum sp.]